MDAPGGSGSRRVRRLIRGGDHGYYIVAQNAAGIQSSGGSMNKRDFLRSVGGASVGLMFGPELLAQYADTPAHALAEDEVFWAAVRTKFRLTPEYINLENGYYCFQPEEVLEQFISHVRHVNYMGSRYMRTVKDEDKLRVRTKLAALAGCSPAELI